MHHLTIWRLLGMVGLTVCAALAVVEARSSNLKVAWIITVAVALITWGIGIGFSFAGI